MARRALDGVKVADFGTIVAGPLTTKYLADHGATVVTVEYPGYANLLRTAVPFKDGIPGVNRSGQWLPYNSSKYSISLNLRESKGMEIAKKLVMWADIMVENWRPGVMDKLGLGFEDVSMINPGIIMLSTSMQGQTGPRARTPGLGVQMAALAGFSEILGWPDRDPLYPYGAYTDFIAPRFQVAALVAALIKRKKTGKGQHLDMSQFEGSVHFIAPLILDYVINGRIAGRKGNRCDYAAPHGVYRCRGEDRWCVITIFTDKEWRKFCQVIEKPAWTEDVKFSTLSSRKKNEDELDRLIADWTINFTSEEVMSLMQTSGLAAGAVHDGEGVCNDPQLKARHYFWWLDHPEMGNVAHEGMNFEMSKSPGRLRCATCLGEHTEYVCTQLLGISDAEFVQLAEERIFEP